jgi:hypothetical protein
MAFVIDISIRPNIYRTDNPDYYGKLAIDFAPENVPTVARFDNLQQVKDWLIEKFGEEQYPEWFPSGLAEELPDGQASQVS